MDNNNNFFKDHNSRYESNSFLFWVNIVLVPWQKLMSHCAFWAFTFMCGTLKYFNFKMCKLNQNILKYKHQKSINILEYTALYFKILFMKHSHRQMKTYMICRWLCFINSILKYNAVYSRILMDFWCLYFKIFWFSLHILKLKYFSVPHMKVKAQKAQCDISFCQGN
jgi:hypothetical protein